MGESGTAGCAAGKGENGTDGWMVAHKVGRERDGRMVALLVGSEKDG